MVISPSFDVPIFRICVYARYNIQYGRIGASNSEVEEAASSADMHSRILTFPKGERRTVKREKDESFSDDHGYGSPTNSKQDEFSSYQHTWSTAALELSR